MADSKISALPSGAPAQSGDEYVVARSGANYKLSLTNIAASMPDTTIKGSLVVNEDGADKDTRIEGDNDANLLFVDASTDRIGVGTPTPAQKIDLASGNLIFSNTGQKILGKFSGAWNGRTVFQNYTTDAETRVGIIPNGTSTTASWSMSNSSSDPSNSGSGSIRITNTAFSVNSNSEGTGTPLPIQFNLYDAAESSGGTSTTRMVILNDGKVGIATLTPGSELDVKGTVRLSGSSSGYVGLAPAAAAGSTTYTLPSADGSSGQFLSTNSSGTLSWASGNAGTVTSVSGTGTVNGLTLTGTVTSSGSLTLGGTLDLSSPPAIGGTSANTGAFTTLSATGVTTVQAGTSSAPAVTKSGDTDTGLYFPAANEAAITTGGTVAAAFNSNGLFFRNRIINGDMRIDQRNAGAAVTINTTANVYTIDRWNGTGQVTDGVFTVQQDTTVPTGFTNSSKITVTTADASLGATQQYLFRQAVEGNNIADWGWGAAGALTVTLSFWVRSSVTGTFGGTLNNNGNTRNYPFTYVINSANTWEYKTVTIAGDTTGTWATNTDRGVVVTFSLGTGTSQSATAGAWTGTTSIFSATGATNLMATLNATWYITGVQLETGSVATPFERRPYGTELMLCQRYYEKGKGDARGAVNATTQVGNQINFRVTKRAAPTVTITTVAGAPASFSPDVESFLFYGTTGENTGTWTAAIEL